MFEVNNSQNKFLSSHLIDNEILLQSKLVDPHFDEVFSKIDSIQGREFKLIRGNSGKICIENIRSIPELLRGIYCFKNMKEKVFYIGKADSIKERAQKHCCDFTRGYIKKKADSIFVEKVHKAFSEFRFSILRLAEDHEELNDLEREKIKEYKENGYKIFNLNNGGGGGEARRREARLAKYCISTQIPFTPERNYQFFKNKRGKVSICLSPSFKMTVKQYSAVVYRIKNVKNPEEVYVGTTSGLNRPHQHSYSANFANPHHKNFDPSVLSGLVHKRLGSNPENFVIGILPVTRVEEAEINNENEVHLGQEQLFICTSLAEAERKSIEIKNSWVGINKFGLNSNRGGGGPIARRLCFNRI